MMTNLFSIFDPSTNIFNLSLNWLSAMLGLLFIPFSFWLIPNRHQLMWTFISNKLHNEFKILLGNNNKSLGSTFIFISLFFFILFNNFLGLFPYIFTSTSHLNMSLSISLTFWLSFMFYGWLNNTKHMFIHMIPQGTPTILMPFMVLIETISNSIRPWYFSNSFNCNYNYSSFINYFIKKYSKNFKYMFIISTIFIQIMLLILESMVAIIQSYVISILSALYSSEVN
uniref:ATP synthase subunit a n=1 Tax=Tirumala limniace TaxID=551222 RepID=A0A0A7HE04_TIRLI|nr:ATP synthase F0 subunit 6 [Tirumala limniace]